MPTAATSPSSVARPAVKPAMVTGSVWAARLLVNSVRRETGRDQGVKVPDH